MATQSHTIATLDEAHIALQETILNLRADAKRYDAEADAAKAKAQGVWQSIWQLERICERITGRAPEADALPMRAEAA